MRIETNRETTVADLRELLKDADPSTVIVFGKTLKSKQKNECWCGCGGETGGKFVPGHDSRFHSLAKKVARGQETMPTSFVCDEAEADFMMWHDREVPIWEAKQKLVAAVAAAKPTKVKPVVESVEEVGELDEDAQALLEEMAAVED
jgi:hypothetical protein